MTKTQDIWVCSECGLEQGRHDMWFDGDICGTCHEKNKPNTRTFYFNSGVKPWNTDVEMQTRRGNKFINGELHHPFEVSMDVPDNARLVCLMNEPFEYYNDNDFIIAEVLGGNMASKYAVFRKSNS